MDLFYRFATSCLYLGFRLFYRCQIYGNRHPCETGAIIAPNHVSFLDPPLIGAFWPADTHFLARASLFKPGFMGWVLPKMHSHPVQGTAQDIDSMRMVCQLIKEGNKVVIFPEGNRSEDGQLQPIKSGISMLAMRMNCPIIPVYIQGTYEAWPRQSRWPKPGKEIAVVVGNPIYPSKYLELKKKEGQEQLTQDVLRAIDSLRTWYQAGASGLIP